MPRLLAYVQSSHKHDFPLLRDHFRRSARGISSPLSSTTKVQFGPFLKLRRERRNNPRKHHGLWQASTPSRIAAETPTATRSINCGAAPNTQRRITFAEYCRQRRSAPHPCTSKPNRPSVNCSPTPSVASWTATTNAYTPAKTLVPPRRRLATAHRRSTNLNPPEVGSPGATLLPNGSTARTKRARIPAGGVMPRYSHEQTPARSDCANRDVGQRAPTPAKLLVVDVPADSGAPRDSMRACIRGRVRFGLGQLFVGRHCWGSGNQRSVSKCVGRPVTPSGTSSGRASSRARASRR